MSYCPVCGKDIGEKPFDEGGWCPNCVGTKEYMELEGKLEEYKKNEESLEKNKMGANMGVVGWVAWNEKKKRECKKD
ncbi:hypothetical protein [Methanobacterium spitsbergense]|uniref:Uncharacterized protein n=1 Tax=Methanobacterium spitsbergense TaxID=2874285 RepID=A0A8T5UZQ1_9EURY|nr:hypothetical protein [Methanobacterium spitsbergense]MBZ2166650.1 hypothetical protein [Methanobacterium spitsbergense]